MCNLLLFSIDHCVTVKMYYILIYYSKIHTRHYLC